MNIRSLAFAGAAAFMIAVPFMGSAEAATIRCMTDDGYGRYRPCDSSYKAANPNWRASDQCMTDDGYGRYRPCSSSYKAKHDKAKK
jgi:hypothetical protein